MRKVVIMSVVPLLASSLLAGCNQGSNQAQSNTAAGQTAMAANPDKCVDGNAMNVGDTDVTLTLAGTDYHWDTRGAFVTLTTSGNGKDVQLVQSTSVGGPSLPEGDCLRSGGYIRLASTRHADANRFLQALQTDGVDPGANPDPHHVTIGNYPDPTSIDSIFNVVKIGTAPGSSPGAIIRKGDTIIIRGVSHDPWLKAPATPTEGSAIDLIDWNQDASASRWVISKGK